MKKILIVAKDALLRDTLAQVCKKMEFEAITVDHATALKVFLTQEPVAVIVCDYDENSDKEVFKGVETFGDIKGSATNEIVLRLGFKKMDSEDYLQMPFDKEKLKKKLVINIPD